MTRMVTAATGAVALIVGFGIASVTGVRWLGGIALIAGAIWCGIKWWRMAGPLRAIIAVLLSGIAFVISHPLGAAIGAWPSVFVVAVFAGVLAYAITPQSSERQ